MNPLVPQDHIPLGITWITSGLLELVASLLHPVSLHVIVIPERISSSLLCC